MWFERRSVWLAEKEAYREQEAYLELSSSLAGPGDHRTLMRKIKVVQQERRRRGVEDEAGGADWLD